MANLERWRYVWTAVGAAAVPEALFEEIQAAYGERRRAYHTLQHVAECLVYLDTLRSLALRPAELELAIWFHDAVYDPQRADNEEKSAAWARESVMEADLPPEVGNCVYELVLMTKHLMQPTEPDACLLVDIDLAILGAAPERFAEYEAQIRQEYSWLPEDEFRPARAGVLQDILARERVYATDYFVQNFEAAARANLEGALQRLGY